MKIMNDFHNIQPGDTFEMTGTPSARYEVKRVSKHFFWTVARQFRKSDGLLIGSHYPKRYAIQHTIMKKTFAKVVVLNDHKARVCDCGSVNFNLLMSGNIECAGCSARVINTTWSESK